MKFGTWVFVAIATVAIAVPASATPLDFITAYGWVTTEAIANSPTGGSAASLALPTCHNGVSTCTTANADVTFTTTGVNFNTTGSTVAQWLASNAFPVNNLVDTVPGHLMDATIWEFVGNISVTSPDPFTISHDDGATFIVNGQTVINAPGPTAPAVTNGTYTGAASGSVPFVLYYTECCGGPAVIDVSLLAPANAPAAVPEPATLVLLGTGLAFGARRLRKRA